MYKQFVVYILCGISFSEKEEGNCVICRKMDRTKDYHAKANHGLTKTNVEIFSCMEVNTKKKKQKQKRHY